jgi:hypothetical protein
MRNALLLLALMVPFALHAETKREQMLVTANVAAWAKVEQTDCCTATIRSNTKVLVTIRSSSGSSTLWLPAGVHQVKLTDGSELTVELY